MIDFDVIWYFFWKQPPDISDGRCPSFFGNNYSTFPTVIVQNTVDTIQNITNLQTIKAVQTLNAL